MHHNFRKTTPPHPYFFFCRSTLQYTSSETPFLPVRNNLQSGPHTLRGTPAGTLGAGAGSHPLTGLRGGLGAGHLTAGRPGSLRNSRFSEKNIAGRCSWRCVAIFFVVLALILSAALAYITGKSRFPDPSFSASSRLQ